MSENTRKPLSEQHPAWQAALRAPFEPETPEEAAFIAAHPIGEGPTIPHEQIERMLAYGAKCAAEEREACAEVAHNFVAKTQQEVDSMPALIRDAIRARGVSA